jgi:hypothetical protein
MVSDEGHNNDFQLGVAEINDVSHIATDLRSCMMSFGMKHYTALFLLSAVLIQSIRLAHAQGNVSGSTYPVKACQSLRDDLISAHNVWEYK